MSIDSKFTFTRGLKERKKRYPVEKSTTWVFYYELIHHVNFNGGYFFHKAVTLLFVLQIFMSVKKEGCIFLYFTPKKSLDAIYFFRDVFFFLPEACMNRKYA